MNSLDDKWVGRPDEVVTIDEDVPDMVNHPPHYNKHPSGVECITITEHFNFNIGNAIKYSWRSDDKGNAIEDLMKAEWYIRREIKRRQTLALADAKKRTP